APVGVRGWPVLGRETEERGDHRLFSRPGATSVAEIHRAVAVGRRPPDRGVGAAGWHGIGRIRWCHRFRSLGLPETRQGLGGRSTAVVWPLRENRQLPGGHLSRLRFAKRA